MGGKARLPALKANQRFAWVRKVKAEDDAYRASDDSFLIDGSIQGAMLFDTRISAETWIPFGYRAIRVIVTVEIV